MGQYCDSLLIACGPFDLNSVVITLNHGYYGVILGELFWVQPIIYSTTLATVAHEAHGFLRVVPKECCLGLASPLKASANFGLTVTNVA
jgi:hypothetical protein